MSIFLFFAFITNLSIAFSNNDVEQVLDINGNPIFPGSKYYIMPAVQEDQQGGGLTLRRTSVYSDCPVTVLHDIYADGIPVKFGIPEISSDIIFTGTPLEIEFIHKPDCAKSSKWLVFIESSIMLPCVGIGGPENYPTMGILSGTFNIHKYGSGNVYKLGFCMSITCFDIGTRFDFHEGGSRLALAETESDVFQVVFVDAVSYEAGVIKSVV